MGRYEAPGKDPRWPFQRAEEIFIEEGPRAAGIAYQESVDEWVFPWNVQFLMEVGGMRWEDAVLMWTTDAYASAREGGYGRPRGPDSL